MRIIVVRPRTTLPRLIQELVDALFESVDLSEPRFTDALIVVGPAGFRIHRRE